MKAIKDSRIFSKNSLYRILIFVFILLIVAGIWVYRNIGTRGLEAGLSEFDFTHRFDLEEILSRGKPVMIQFGAEGCPPCQQMKDDLVAIYTTWNDRIAFAYVDIWKDPSAGAGFPLRVIPTQFFFNREGNLVFSNEGKLTYQEMDSILKGLEIRD